MDGFKERIARLLGRNARHLLEIYYGGRHLLGNTGVAHRCPCCGSQLRRFLPGTVGSQGTLSGIRCPRCDSHPRHRLLWLFLQNDCQQLFEENLSLLHIAPEFCFLRRFRKMANLRYVTGDLVSPLADSRFDLTLIPFADGTFDVIFCNHVLEHVSDDRPAIRELYRVMKPGGWGILQVPVEPGRTVTFEDDSITTPVERARHFGQHDHVRSYGADYPERLRAAGFAVQAIDHVQTFAVSRLKYYGLLPAETIYLCRRPLLPGGAAPA